MLLKYLKERINAGETVPRIPKRFALGNTGICGFNVSNNMQVVLPVHRHEYFEMFITISDDVIHIVNGEEIRLPRNTVVLVRPDDAHTQIFTNKKQERKIMNVTFTVEVMEHVFDFLADAGVDKERFLASGTSPSRQLSEMQAREFVLEYEKRVPEEMKNEVASRQQIYGFLTYVFLNLFSAPTNINIEVQHPPYWLEVACVKMKRFENFYEGLPRMLQISGKSQEHLARSMKKYYGITTSQYINDLRLSYVASRLMNVGNEESMLEIILDAGFQSSGHFYKLFEEKYGMTPKKYRQIFM